jgi:hypothetical protein
MAYLLDNAALDELESTIEIIDVEDLEVDPAIQRPLDKNKVRRLFKEFTAAGVGTLAVSRRTKPVRNAVLDGQHRLEVLRLKLAEGGPKAVRCEVFTGLTTEQEAALFLTLNNTTKPRAVDKFKVAVTAGDPTAVAVQKLLESYGLALATYPRNGNISAVDVMRRIYIKSEKRGFEPNTLQLTLLTLERAWGGAEYSLKGIMLDAVAAMYDEYGDHLNVSEFIERLRDHKPRDLVFDGQHHAAVKKVKPAMGLAEVLVGVYNTDSRGRRRVGKARLWDWGRRR